MWWPQPVTFTRRASPIYTVPHTFHSVGWISTALLPRGGYLKFQLPRWKENVGQLRLSHIPRSSHKERNWIFPLTSHSDGDYDHNVSLALSGPKSCHSDIIITINKYKLMYVTPNMYKSRYWSWGPPAAWRVGWVLAQNVGRLLRNVGRSRICWSTAGYIWCNTSEVIPQSSIEFVPGGRYCKTPVVQVCIHLRGVWVEYSMMSRWMFAVESIMDVESRGSTSPMLNPPSNAIERQVQWIGVEI